MLLGEQLPLEVLPDESQTRRVVFAEELDDLDRRHDLAFIDSVKDPAHIDLMPRKQVGRAGEVAEDGAVKRRTGGTVSS